MTYPLPEPDEIELQVRLVEEPEGSSDEIWSVEFAAEEVDDPLALIERLVRSIVDPDTGPPTFVVDRRQNYYEWGAEGATETIIMAVAGATVYNVLKAAFLGLVEEIRAAGKPSTIRSR